MATDGTCGRAAEPRSLRSPATLFGAAVDPGARHRRDPAAGHRSSRDRRRELRADACRLAPAGAGTDYAAFISRPAGRLDRADVRPERRARQRRPARRRSRRPGAGGGAPAGSRTTGRCRTTACVRRSRTCCCGGSGSPDPARPPTVRLPAAPVPVQGRHRLRHPRAARQRHITSTYQVRRARRQPGQAILFPLAFCRECGQEYSRRHPAATTVRPPATRPRRDSDASGGDDGERLPLHQRRPAVACDLRTGADRGPAARLVAEYDQATAPGR